MKEMPESAEINNAQDRDIFEDVIEFDKRVEVMRLENIMEDFFAQNPLGYRNVVMPFLDEIKMKYPRQDLMNYGIYDILTGSRFWYERENFDFPGGEGVKFIESLQKPEALEEAA